MTRADLEEAKVKMYQKLDLGRPILIVTGVVAGILIAIAFLNIADVINIPLRTEEAPAPVSDSLASSIFGRKVALMMAIVTRNTKNEM